MPIIDLTAKVQVDLLHINKLSWADQRRRIVDMYKKWGCRRLVAEANSIGGPNAEALVEEGLNVIRFTMTNTTKAEIMAQLYEGLHALS